MPTKTYQIRKTLTVEHKPTGVRGVHVYRATWTEKNKDPVIGEGICRKRDLPNPDFPKPLRWWTGLDDDPRKHGIWYLVSKYDLNRFLKKGHPLTWDEESNLDERFHQPYTFFDDSDMILIRDYTDGHLMFFADGSIVPLAQKVEYCHWNVTNERYKLERAYDILAGRKDIADDLSIKEIPYYNREPGRTHYLEFTWRPSAKDFQKIWNYILREYKTYPSTAFPLAVVDLDFWGIEKVRKSD